MIPLKILKLSIAVFSAVLAAGCGQQSTPTEAMARDAFVERMKSAKYYSDVELVGFKKTNGIAHELMGIKGYTLKYEATLKYTKGLNADCPELLKRPDATFKPNDPQKTRRNYFCGTGTKIILPGETEVQYGDANFILTENGWTTNK